MSNIYYESIADYLLSLGFIIDGEFFVKPPDTIHSSELVGKSVADFKQMAQEKGWVMEEKAEEAQGRIALLNRELGLTEKEARRLADLILRGFSTSPGSYALTEEEQRRLKAVIGDPWQPAQDVAGLVMADSGTLSCWKKYVTLGHAGISPTPKANEPARVEEPVIKIYLNGKVLTPGKNCQVIRLGNLWIVNIEQEEPQEDEPDLWPALHEGLGRKET